MKWPAGRGRPREVARARGEALELAELGAVGHRQRDARFAEVEGLQSFVHAR